MNMILLENDALSLFVVSETPAVKVLNEMDFHKLYISDWY